jgi:hypothetical protein
MRERHSWLTASLTLPARFVLWAADHISLSAAQSLRVAANQIPDNTEGHRWDYNALSILKQKRKTSEKVTRRKLLETDVSERQTHKTKPTGRKP